MTKNEFIQKLRSSLSGLTSAQVDDICADYEEHFAMASASGKTEATIASSLGDPKMLAQSHLATEHLARATASTSVTSRSQSILQILKALAILAPLNFLVLIGPVAILAFVLIVTWSVSLSILAAGFSGLFYYFGVAGSLGAPVAAHVSLITLAAAAIGVGVLLNMLNGLATKVSLGALLNYVRWNVDFVLNRKEVTQK